jgi:predicted nucleic acid-binding Zn ribbon protein
MKDAALTECPKDRCPKKKWGKGKVKRLLGSGAGLIFKGSGFYITDYRSEGYKTAAKSDAPAPAPAKTETKTETKKTGSSTKKPKAG